MGALVYVAGGTVLALRLYFHGLPVLAVPGQLPKEFVISIGLSQVVLPSAGVAAVYVVYRLVRGFGKAPELKPWALQPRFEKVRTAGLGTWLAALMLLAGATIATEQGRLGSLQSMLALGGAFAILWFVAWLVLEARARLSRRDVDWNGWFAVGGMVGLVGACGIAASIPAAAALPLLKSRLCANGETAYSGVLIGETDDRVYLGIDDPSRIVAVPRMQAGELVIGGSSNDECELPGPRPGDSG